LEENKLFEREFAGKEEMSEKSLVSKHFRGKSLVRKRSVGGGGGGSLAST